MPRSRRTMKLGRWAKETAYREAPLEAVSDARVTRIAIPSDDTPETQWPVSKEAAALAVQIRDLRRQLRRWRWIPWRRRQRPQLHRRIDELVRRHSALRRSRGHQSWL